jgi:hypothetical protein
MNWRSVVVGEVLVIAIAYWAQNGQLGLFARAMTGAAVLTPNAGAIQP